VDLAIRSLHLIAAAVWAGGLVMLAIVAGVARAQLDDAERVAMFRALGRRFLVVSLAAAAVLAATGADMAADRLATWDALTETETGRLITAKTVLFAIALGLAVVHALVLGPRIRRRREALQGGPGDGEAERDLRRLSAASGMIQGVILLLTIAILVLAADLIA
jgi:putative copper export protein